MGALCHHASRSGAIERWSMLSADLLCCDICTAPFTGSILSTTIKESSSLLSCVFTGVRKFHISVYGVNGELDTETF